MAEPALESAARVAEQILSARYPDQTFVVTVEYPEGDETNTDESDGA